MPYAARLLMYRKLAAMPLCFDAVFSDESADYFDEDSKAVRLRLKKGQLATCWVCVKGADSAGNEPVLMKKTESSDYFDYYSADIGRMTSNRPFRYYFVIKTDWDDCYYYYNKAGVTSNHSGDYDFTVIPGFVVPEWAKGAVMYQVFVDRFYNGDTSNDVVNNEYAYLGRAAKRMDWHDPIENLDVANFYGGDLSGLLIKLPYLKELGVEVIYLNPIFVSPSTHKYDIQDYGHVDPHFGVIKNDGGSHLLFERFNNKYATKYIKRVTDEENLEHSDALLAHTISEAHKLGIRVILDGVFNHCGAFNKWLDREGFYEKAGEPPGAYRDKDSPYHGFFRWLKDDWPDNGHYDSWWGHDNQPKLNFEDSAELCSYILDVARKWVSPPFNADGWRLDVAADLGHSRTFNISFWQQFRDVVKEANPEAIILAEHYGDPKDWLSGGEWDTIMNYDAFMEPVTWYLCGMQKHSENFRKEAINNMHDFERQMAYFMARMPRQSLLAAMNQLSNHDHSRFLTRTNMQTGRLHTHGRQAADKGTDKRVMYLAVLMQMTWPGAPCIYYGDEAGLTGWTDPDNRRTYPWGREDKELIEFHKAAIRARNINSAARDGSLIYLVKQGGVLCYARTKGRESLITVINNTGEEAVLDIPVWKLDIGTGNFNIPLQTNGTAFETKNPKAASVNGFLGFTAPAKSGAIITVEQEDTLA